MEGPTLWWWKVNRARVRENRAELEPGGHRTARRQEPPWVSARRAGEQAPAHVAGPSEVSEVSAERALRPQVPRPPSWKVSTPRLSP